MTYKHKTTLTKFAMNTLSVKLKEEGGEDYEVQKENEEVVDTEFPEEEEEDE